MEPASGSAFLCPDADITAKDASIPKPGISITAIHTPKKLKHRSSKHSNRHISRDFPSSAANPSSQRTKKELAGLLQKIKESYPEKNVWCYTGYLYDVDLIPGGKVYTEYTDQMLDCIDTLVDGEFIEAEKDLTLEIPRKPQPENPAS